MFPTRTTSTTGTLRVPPLASPVAVRAADPAPAPAAVPVPVPAAAPEPTPAPAAHPGYAAAPTHTAVAVAVAAPREAVEPGPPPALVGSPAMTEQNPFGRSAADLPQGWEVPAARAHPYDEGDQGADPGLDIPHPQDEEAHAGVATLRLRAAEPKPTPAAEPESKPAAEPAAPAPAAAAAPPAPASAATAPAPAHAPESAPEPVPVPQPVPAPEPAAAAPAPAPAPAPKPAAAPAAASPSPAPEAEPAHAHAPAFSSAPALAPEAEPAHAHAPAFSSAPALAPEAAPAQAHAPEAEPARAHGPAPAFAPAPTPVPAPERPAPAPAAAAPALEPAPAPERPAPGAPVAAHPHSGIPGPGPVEIVARAVARGLDEAEAGPDLPLPSAHRGASAVEVPVHLPFRTTQQLPVVPAPAPAPARPAPARSTARAPRPAPGRRVPRGDDRLREHRGPVLPGWVGVSVGGLALAGCVAVLWRAGVVPAPFVAAFGAAPRAYHGLRATHWPPLAFLGIVALVALGGLGRARTGHAWVLTLFGRYRGTVRRTGLTWVSPLLLRRRVDVRLRHWRSDPMPAVDSGGLALQVVVQVVWQVRDTARATLAVEDHTEYLAEQVESAMARVLSQLPADAFHEDAPTLRDAEAVGDALTRMLAAETEAVGIEVFSAQPTRIEYAAEVAEAMRRRRVAAIDAKHRDTVLTSVVDAVDDTVHRLTSRGLVELDDYERKALVKDLTVAFYTGRSE
ncbi:SPFH domain-containing protein [Streptomyces sp. NRRL S-241]|uniref:SPFH domain-containing protein n=1 Tax=Streptomyces sp. NRRL S-241 TaxID=1463896 RepID=UPI000A98EC76|nr:SPFH domain-containing protein [Streptomyces sp. NRRL S-241]